MNHLDELLKQHYAHGDKKELDAQIDQWLDEDLTAEYNRIVAGQETATLHPRPARKYLARWLSAAAAITLLIIIGMWLWPSKSQNEQPEVAKVEKKAPMNMKEESPSNSSPVEVAAKPIPQRNSQRKPHRKKLPPVSNMMAAKATEKEDVSVLTASYDSLDYYLARLEKCLDEVGDSLYQERAEQIIRADVRLQRLVKRIYMDDIERQRQRQQAMYLHY